MERPTPVVIELTDEQVEKLADHYAYVNQQWEQGEPGILAAQVGAEQFGGHRYIKVGFVAHDAARTIVGAAK